MDRRKRRDVQVRPPQVVRRNPNLAIHAVGIGPVLPERSVLFLIIVVLGMPPLHHALPCQKRVPLGLKTVDARPQIPLHGKAEVQLPATDLQALLQVAVADPADLDLPQISYRVDAQGTTNTKDITITACPHLALSLEKVRIGTNGEDNGGELKASAHLSYQPDRGFDWRSTTSGGQLLLLQEGAPKVQLAGPRVAVTALGGMDFAAAHVPRKAHWVGCYLVPQREMPAGQVQMVESEGGKAWMDVEDLMCRMIPHRKAAQSCKLTLSPQATSECLVP